MIEKVVQQGAVFVYGVSDKPVKGLDLLKPGGGRVSVRAASLQKDVPAPFREEVVGGGGIRMHHKFVVIDFDQPSARVYVGSHNFSSAADRKNGDNLLLIRDKRIATSYMVEALRLFDYYHFRVSQMEARSQIKTKRIELLRAPQGPADPPPWWNDYYQDPRKIRDRELFV